MTPEQLNDEDAWDLCADRALGVIDLLRSYFHAHRESVPGDIMPETVERCLNSIERELNTILYQRR